LTLLVLVPGLGADAALFEPQCQEFKDSVVLEWLTPMDGESLVGYAKRLAGTVPSERPVVLCGVSFGGMLASEMAYHVHPAAVILVATCRTPSAIPWHNRVLARVVTFLPGRLLRPPAFVRPLVAWAFGARRGKARAIIDNCVLTASPAFVQWGLSAILSWQPSPSPAAPIVHVQGARDRLIPAARVDATEVVPGAGHLLNVTHPGALNERIAIVLQRVADSLREADTL
jgi:pimeloyl-ACP methyl ester carboxylesterase